MLRIIGLMVIVSALAVIALAIFYLLEIATRPDYVVRPGYYVEVPR